MPTTQACGAYGSLGETPAAAPAQPHGGQVAYASPAGRGLVAAVTLGTAMVFLDTTAVNVAVPTIGLELGAAVSQLQWVLTGYTLTLSAFLLLGGPLGRGGGGDGRADGAGGCALRRTAAPMRTIAPDLPGPGDRTASRPGP
jgi:hypothetical protein